MSYLALARKWRPRRFSELVGQEHVLRALSNALDSGRVHHAFLFTGTRGVGKTTIARILAKSLNCEVGVTAIPCGECAACREIDAGRFVDLLEVDAASRTKVDDTRELLDNVQYAPARGRYKVYLIDEVHMLSTHSFNALLKTLEEPPPHVKFLLATTDPQKLPVTVLSRCLQFNLKRLPAALIVKRLAEIAAAEQITTEPEALRLIAKAAEGSMRDALSLLDQIIAFGGGKVAAADTRIVLGALDRSHVLILLEALAVRDARRVIDRVADLDERAPDYREVLADLAALLQRIALLQAVPDLALDEDEDATALKRFAQTLQPEELQLYYQIALLGRRDLDLAPDGRAGFEMVLLRMLAFQPHQGNSNIEPIPPAASGIAVKPASTPARALPPIQSSPPGPASSAHLQRENQDWNSIVAALQLMGPVSQLAAHCSLVSKEGTRIQLLLDEEGQPYRRPQLEEKLRQALTQYFGEEIKLQLDSAQRVVDTPARRRAAEAEDALSAARNAIDNDPTVGALRDVFGATVQPESVKPLR